MRFSSLLTLLPLLPFSLATSGKHDCLPKHKVDELVEGYVALVSDIGSLSTEEIDDLMHPNFVDYSDSIAAFFGAPYGVPIFPSKDVFVTAQQKAKQAPIEVLSYFHACDKIVLIFNGLFQDGLVSRGISIITTEIDGTKEEYERRCLQGRGNKKVDWKISRLDVEFNSLAWAVGLGGGYTVFDQTKGVGCGTSV